MKLLLQILLLLTCLTQASPLLASTNLVNTTFSPQATQKLESEQKASVFHFARIGIEENYLAQPKSHFSTSKQSPSFLKDTFQNFSVLQLEKSLATSWVGSHDFSQKEQLSLLENRAREVLGEGEEVVSGAGRFQNLLSKLDNFPHAKAFVNSLDEVADVALINKLDDFIEATPAVRTKLNNYLNGASNDFKVALRQPNGIDAWKLVDEAISPSVTTQFAKDPATLRKVSDMISEGSGFRAKFPNTWQQELSTIIEKNTILPCRSCGTPSGLTAQRYPMDEFLEQVDFFVAHYDVNATGKKFYNWLKRVGADGSGTMNAGGNIEEMYQTLYHIKSQNITNVVDFGRRFPKGTKEFDLFFGGTKYTELKNVDFTKNPLSLDMQDQLIFGYFKNIATIDDLQWIAHFKKLQAGGWSTQAIAQTNLKNMWKTVFQKRKTEIFNTIWDNQSLRGSLFPNLPTEITPIVKQQYFTNQFDNLVNTTESILYNFIKVQ